MDSKTSTPLVIAGIGFCIVWYNPMNLRAGGYLLLSLGLGMSLIQVLKT